MIKQWSEDLKGQWASRAIEEGAIRSHYATNRAPCAETKMHRKTADAKFCIRPRTRAGSHVQICAMSCCLKRLSILKNFFCWLNLQVLLPVLTVHSSGLSRSLCGESASWIWSLQMLAHDAHVSRFKICDALFDTVRLESHLQKERQKVRAKRWPERKAWAVNIRSYLDCFFHDELKRLLNELLGANVEWWYCCMAQGDLLFVLRTGESRLEGPLGRTQMDIGQQDVQGQSQVDLYRKKQKHCNTVEIENRAWESMQ